MPFPLPVDPAFRKEVIMSWLEDIEDQLEVSDVEKAKESMAIALRLYLSLPAGCGDFAIEDQIGRARVKLGKHPHT
jgi:hypothetical protein